MLVHPAPSFLNSTPSFCVFLSTCSGCLPYCLVLFRTREGASECLALYDGHLEERHHRVSKEFLSPSGRLRSHVESLAQGGPMSDVLNSALVSLEMVPLNEAVHPQRKFHAYVHIVCESPQTRPG